MHTSFLILQFYSSLTVAMKVCVEKFVPFQSFIIFRAHMNLRSVYRTENVGYFEYTLL